MTYWGTGVKGPREKSCQHDFRQIKSSRVPAEARAGRQETRQDFYFAGPAGPRTRQDFYFAAGGQGSAREKTNKGKPR